MPTVPSPSMTRRELAACAFAAAGQPAFGQASFGSMLWDYVREYLRLLDERRAERLAALESAADFESLRQRTRQQLERMWGPFPARAPLNAQRVGTLARAGYAIEKIVFESREAFHVTANLYRPLDGAGSLPAIAFACGHAAEGKAGESYQRFAILMARLGFAVLAWDPLGQGERIQFLDPATGGSVFGAGTAEHRVLGHQCYLLGDNLMQYRAWDAARALDYLQQRSDVDSGRIGIAGQSGGGTTVLQFACFDDRIQAAFSSCAVASLRAKAEALLVADPEQVLVACLREGIDHPELLAAFAPKPLLIGAAERDFVPIAGTRRTHAELEGVYGKLGAPANLHLAVTDAGHGLNGELREAAAAFFLQTLGGRQETVREAEAQVASPAELACTSTGQVASALDSRSAFAFNAARADAIAPAIPAARRASEFEVFRNEVANRIRAVTRVGAFKTEYGIDVQSRFLDAGVYAKGAVFLVAEQGKDHPIVRRYYIDAVVAANHSVYGLDLRGWGASAPAPSPSGPDFRWDDFFAYRSLELGRPLLGQRLKDLLAAAPKLTKRREWIVAGIGVGGLIAAHAAALDPRISGVVSIGAPLSFRSILNDPHAAQPASCLLPGVLKSYEIRDVYAALAPRPLLVVNAENPRRRTVSADEARGELAPTQAAYAVMEAEDAFRVEAGRSHSEIRSLLGEWLRAVSG